MKMTFASSLIAVAGLIVGVGCACKTKAGDSCTKGQAACKDDNTSLSCQDGKFIESPCKGAKGCKVEGATVDCDITGNAAGDLCSTDDEGNTACSADGKTQIECKGGKYAVQQCRGPDGCKQNGLLANCDVSIAQLGDACEGVTGGYACSVDKKALLKCKNGKFEVDEQCPAGKPCKIAGDSAGCSE